MLGLCQHLAVAKYSEHGDSPRHPLGTRVSTGERIHSAAAEKFRISRERVLKNTFFNSYFLFTLRDYGNHTRLPSILNTGIPQDTLLVLGFRLGNGSIQLPQRNSEFRVETASKTGEKRVFRTILSIFSSLHGPTRRFPGILTTRTSQDTP